MTPRSTPTCAHERRPGTIVCLRCRHDELVATRERRRKTGMLLLAKGTGAAVLLGVIASAVTTLGGETPKRATTAQTADAPVVQTVEPQSFAVTQSGQIAEASVASAPVPTVTPALPAGRTALPNGWFAERIGDTVVVHFDTPGGRTRRSDKFEHVVRETLPVVLGDAGRSAIAQIQPGKLVAPGRLLAMLDSGPLHLPVGDGRAIRMMPGARPGQDGPLVVTYRVVIETKAPSAS